MSEHHDSPKAHEPHALHEEHAKGPHNLKEINPKMASDIAYWSKEFGVTGDQLHEAIRSHGTHVEKDPRRASHSQGLLRRFLDPTVRKAGTGFGENLNRPQPQSCRAPNAWCISTPFPVAISERSLPFLQRPARQQHPPALRSNDQARRMGQC